MKWVFCQSVKDWVDGTKRIIALDKFSWEVSADIIVRICFVFSSGRLWWLRCCTYFWFMFTFDPDGSKHLCSVASTRSLGFCSLLPKKRSGDKAYPACKVQQQLGTGSKNTVFRGRLGCHHQRMWSFAPTLASETPSRWENGGDMNKHPWAEPTRCGAWEVTVSETSFPPHGVPLPPHLHRRKPATLSIYSFQHLWFGGAGFHSSTYQFLPH